MLSFVFLAGTQLGRQCLPVYQSIPKSLIQMFRHVQGGVTKELLQGKGVPAAIYKVFLCKGTSEKADTGLLHTGFLL